MALLLGMSFGSIPVQAQNFAYVTNLTSDYVSVIAVSSNTVVDSVAVGNGPNNVAITPDGAFAYIASSIDRTVSKIATVSNTVMATVAAVSFFPIDVAITPNPVDITVTLSVPVPISVPAGGSIFDMTVTVDNNLERSSMEHSHFTGFRWRGNWPGRWNTGYTYQRS